MRLADEGETQRRHEDEDLVQYVAILSVMSDNIVLLRELSESCA